MRNNASRIKRSMPNEAGRSRSLCAIAKYTAGEVEEWLHQEKQLVVAIKSSYIRTGGMATVYLYKINSRKTRGSKKCCSRLPYKWEKLRETFPTRSEINSFSQSSIVGWIWRRRNKLHCNGIRRRNGSEKYIRERTSSTTWSRSYYDTNRFSDWARSPKSESFTAISNYLKTS